MATEIPANSLDSGNKKRPHGRLIVLSGASASGKSTIVSRLVDRPELRVQVSVSATTREPRPGETSGVSYHFLTRQEFETARDRDPKHFLEWAEVHGHLYGTPWQAVRTTLAQGVCIILVIDVQGALKVAEKVPEALLIFVHAPSPETLEARLRARGTDDEATILRRLANARQEIAMADRYDYQIVNDDLDRAVEELASILTQHACGG